MSTRTFADIRRMLAGELPFPHGDPTPPPARNRPRLSWQDVRNRLAGRIVYTIGHSNVSEQHFLHALLPVAPTLVVDVRSHPGSRRIPWANRDALADLLDDHEITYLWLGRQLGGRPSDPALLSPDGSPHIPAILASNAYQAGLAELGKRLLANPAELPVLLCAEEDPRHCHRKWWIAPSLHSGLGLTVRHIRLHAPA